jgi:hypothetical protein
MRLLACAIAAASLALLPASCGYPSFEFGTDLPCGPTLLCRAGQSCCRDPGPAAAHVCRGAGSCPLMFLELACSTAGDCSGGQVCCAQDTDNDGLPNDIRCASACIGADLTLCASTAECPSGHACELLFSKFPGYRACAP